MENSGQEFSGKSVDEAVADGLSQLGLRREQVEVEILSRGSRGIFGLGSEPARVRITRLPPKSEPKQPEPRQPAQPQAQSQTQPQQTEAPAAARTEPAAAHVAEAEAAPAPAAPTRQETPRESTESKSAPTAPDREQLAAMSVEVLSEIVSRMGFEAEIVASWRSSDPGSEPEEESDLSEDSDGEGYLLLDIQGEDVSALIGRRGETLASLQYLVRLIINQRLRQWKNIVVDVEQYKERRVTQLTQLAQRMADQVVQSGRAISLEPMPPNERRIVHLALRDHDSVYTQSSGEGDRRKVHIVAKSQT